jgi:hypothetical protein
MEKRVPIIGRQPCFLKKKRKRLAGNKWEKAKGSTGPTRVFLFFLKIAETRREKCSNMNENRAATTTIIFPLNTTKISKLNQKKQVNIPFRSENYVEHENELSFYRF